MLSAADIPATLTREERLRYAQEAYPGNLVYSMGTWLLTFGAALFLAGCAHAPMSATSSERKVTAANDPHFASASPRPLGTRLDMAEIRRAIAEKHPEMEIVWIRWISSTEVMVEIDRNRHTSLGYEAYLCTLKKRDGVWVWKGWHLALIS
jgi:hypothetical protein